MCLTLRTSDSLKWQPEATAFPSMFAPCWRGWCRTASDNPLPPATSLADRLVRGRESLGLTQKESAKRIGVDPSTLARWERGEREPAGEVAAGVMRFLAKAEAAKHEPGRGPKPAVISGDLRALA
jgi:DNA-binding XRE family transcriptional regulator